MCGEWRSVVECTGVRGDWGSVLACGERNGGGVGKCVWVWGPNALPHISSLTSPIPLSPITSPHPKTLSYTSSHTSSHISPSSPHTFSYYSHISPHLLKVPRSYRQPIIPSCLVRLLEFNLLVYEQLFWHWRFFALLLYTPMWVFLQEKFCFCFFTQHLRALQRRPFIFWEVHGVLAIGIEVY